MARLRLKYTNYLKLTFKFLAASGGFLIIAGPQVFAKAIILLEKPVTAYREKQNLSNTTQIALGAYRVIDVEYETQTQKPLIKIAVPTEKTTTQLGYALSQSPNKSLRGQMLVKVFLALPLKAGDFDKYLEINGSLLKDTGKKFFLPAEPHILARQVTFEQNDEEILWIDINAGRIFYNITLGKANEVLSLAKTLKLSQQEITDKLQKKIKIGDYYRLVLATLGYPLNIKTNKNVIIWSYLQTEYHFKNGKVALIK